MNRYACKYDHWEYQQKPLEPTWAFRARVWWHETSRDHATAVWWSKHDERNERRGH